MVEGRVQNRNRLKNKRTRCLEDLFSEELREEACIKRMGEVMNSFFPLGYLNCDWGKKK